MPLLKPIAGHTGCAGIKHYLEKGGRALGIMVMNFAWQEERAFEDVSAAPAGFDWADSMDATRRACGNDTPYRGKPARTFKHFVMSPDPSRRLDRRPGGGARERLGAQALRRLRGGDCPARRQRAQITPRPHRRQQHQPRHRTQAADPRPAGAQPQPSGSRRGTRISLHAQRHREGGGRGADAQGDARDAAERIHAARRAGESRKRVATRGSQTSATGSRWPRRSPATRTSSWPCSRRSKWMFRRTRRSRGDVTESTRFQTTPPGASEARSWGSPSARRRSGGASTGSPPGTQPRRHPDGYSPKPKAPSS